jgi:hypothetical protein
MRLPVHRIAVLVLCLLTVVRLQAATTLQPQSPAQYRDHLKSLEVLIAQCQKHMDTAHCKADAIGPDDLVAVPNQKAPRRIAYEWLRTLLSSAAKHTLNPADSASLLRAAAQRIQAEESEAASSASRNYTAEHTALSAILDRREFRPADRSLTRRMLDAAFLWINRRFASLAEYSGHRRWLALLLQWGVVALACLALSYWFLRQTRHARAHPSEEPRARYTPGLRNWERLRDDAELATREHRWRDAVRAYYWATIARLELRGHWPADHARTPREYLQLLAPGATKHEDLRRLTQCFETCWYGSENATKPDCEAARQLFERLVIR